MNKDKKIDTMREEIQNLERTCKRLSNRRKELNEVIQFIHFSLFHEPIKIHNRGKNKLKNVFGYKIKCLNETLEIMSNKETMKGIKESMKQIKDGKGIPLSELDANCVNSATEDKL